MKHQLCLAELKLLVMLFGLVIFLCGCSTSYSVRSTAYNEMNEELKGQLATIELRDGKEIPAKDVKISDDSVSWIDQRTNEESKASSGRINKIVIKNYSLEGGRVWELAWLAVVERGRSWATFW